MNAQKKVGFIEKINNLEQALKEHGIQINRSKMIALYNVWKNDDRNTTDFVDFVRENTD